MPYNKITISLERDFSILCAVILIILFAFSGIIAWQTQKSQQDMGEKDLHAALKTIEDSFNTSLTNISDFIQYIGNEVVNAYNGKPESAAHLFKHEFSVDTKLNNFYAWTQLSWVNSQDNVVIAPEGILKTKNQRAQNYPLSMAKEKPWMLHMGDFSMRDNYIYFPVAMGIQSDEGSYIGTIISDVPAEKLQRDIYKMLGRSYDDFQFTIWDEQWNMLIDSRPVPTPFIEPAHFIALLKEEGNVPYYIKDRDTIIHQDRWGNRTFYIAITHNPLAMASNRFWKDFLPHIYLAGGLTVAFLLLIYGFRKRTIVPVINQLKANLAEETAAREEKDRFLNQILGGITGFLYRHRIHNNKIVTEFISEGCSQLTGYPPARYFGKNRIKHSDVIRPDYQEKITKQIQQSLNRGEAFELSYPIIAADGTHKWVLNQGHPIANDPLLFEGLLTDITEMKNTEKKMEETLKALKLSNSELEEVAYACSHDLKEPLRTIFSYMQLYKREGNPDYLTYIENSTVRMKYLIENILLYSKLGITAPVKQESTSLKHIIEHTQQTMHAAISETKAEIHTVVAGNVLGDREQLYRLFQNLFSNALKFKTSHAPHIEIGGTQENGMWKFYVKDNGIGIAKEFHEKIFNLFSRLHSQDHYQGSGIGLTLCKKIVERHGGTIWVESTVNKGATFFFTLPAST